MTDSPELEAARDRVERALADYVAILFPEAYGPDGHFADQDLDPATAGDPLVVGWVAAVEVTNVRLQQGRMAYRYAFAPDGQLSSASEGFAQTVLRSFAPGRSA